MWGFFLCCIAKLKQNKKSQFKILRSENFKLIFCFFTPKPEKILLAKQSKNFFRFWGLQKLVFYALFNQDVFNLVKY